MKKQELRIGNYISDLRASDEAFFSVKRLMENYCVYGTKFDAKYKNIRPIPLNDDWLVKFGFKKHEKLTNINGFDYHFQINRDGRDGTWLSGIGTINYERTGALVVSVLCRGNYVCGNLEYVHQLQNLYFALTGKELKLKQS